MLLPLDEVTMQVECLFSHCRHVEQLNGALINGLEARVSLIEEKLDDLDARTSEEADNALNEREMDRFIMSGELIVCLILVHSSGRFVN